MTKVWTLKIMTQGEIIYLYVINIPKLFKWNIQHEYDMDISRVMASTDI